MEKRNRINKRCELFLREIKSNQVPVFEDNDMVYDVIIDTSESILSSYRYYSKQVYDICIAALRKDLAESDSCDAITDDVLECCIISMSHKGISHPKYRQVYDFNTEGCITPKEGYKILGFLKSHRDFYRFFLLFF